MASGWRNFEMNARICTIAGLALMSMAGAASAQVPATIGAPNDKAALSKSCSTQADAKNLHGKARKHFRSQCKHGH